MTKNSSHSLTISDVNYLTPESVEITFNVPTSLRSYYTFKPGQYVALEKKISGQSLRRTYSISSVPTDGSLSVGIKKVLYGKFSNYAFDYLKVGETLKVFKPDGRFFINYQDNQNLIFIACGSGITPVISIIDFILKTKKNSTITLIYGNKTIESTMYRDRLEALKNSYLEQLSLRYFFSEGNQEIKFSQGRIDENKIEVLINQKQLIPSKVNAVFLCGPQAMTSSMKKIFAQHLDTHVPIISELFVSDEKPTQKKKSVLKKQGKIKSFVKIRIDGIEKNMELIDNETIIDAALRQKIELPFSCKGGMCCTCRCLVKEGEVVLEKNYSLEKWEEEMGFTLACQAYPKTNRVFLDFDAS